MKNIKIVSLLFMVLFLGVSLNGMHRKHQKKQQSKNQIVSAIVQYSGCYGRCTEFSIELKQDGTVIYTGIRFAKDSGVYSKKIEIVEAVRILNLFEKYRVDTCASIYPNRIPDIQVMFFTIKYTNSTKVVRNATFGPGYFTELAAELNNIGTKTDEGWQKINNTYKR